MNLHAFKSGYDTTYMINEENNLNHAVVMIHTTLIMET